jgi:hypothetical protein
VILVFAVLLAGCTSPQPLTEGQRIGIYARAGRVFDQSVLLKPAETNTPLFKLAPLIVKEVKERDSLELLPAKVHAWTNAATLKGKSALQFCYAWNLGPGNDSLRLPQGVKVTLDQSGQPMVWEVLRDASGARVVYVSQTLEAQAMTAFPAPEVGRQFWIERSVVDAPDIVVARVLDDPQVVMGPITYTDPQASEVVTVICRCMDAQARELVDQGEYQLIELDQNSMQQLPRTERRMLESWLNTSQSEDMGEILRLPE